MEITQDDLLQKPETICLTPLGKLTTVFDVIVSNSISKIGQGDIVIYNNSRYQIENVDSDTIMPNDYVKFYCCQIEEDEKRYKSPGGLLYM